jgi:hypothetical protein
LARQILPRRFVAVKVHHDVVRMKVADLGGGRERAAPEYADCKKIADRTGRPLKDVMEDAMQAYRQTRSQSAK